MSITLGPESISIECLPQQQVRKRTVSESYEQNQKRDLAQIGRRTQSYANDMTGLQKNGLKKHAMFNSFLEKQEEEPEIVEKISSWKSIPCLGILFIFLAVVMYQGGSVLAKKNEYRL